MKSDRFRLSVLLCLSAWLALPALLALQSCVIFPSGERRIPVRVEEGAFAPTRYRLINWRDDQERVLGALVVAHMGGAFREFSEQNETKQGWNVDVVLAPDVARNEVAGFVTRRPLAFLWNVVDDALVGGTRFIFPWVRRVDRLVIFRVWHDTRLLCSYAYRSDFYAVGALSSLLLVPWSQRDYARYDVARLARLFVMDAKSDGLFAIAGPSGRQCGARP